MKKLRLPTWWMAPLAAALAAACSGDGKSGDQTDTTPYTREKLLDPQTCNQCHQDHYREWSGSMHAYASTDPVFVAMNKRGQKETNGALGDFCVKCHAPMAVNEHAITDYADISSVPQQLQGVTCYFCHNVTDVTDTHNNPLTLANDVTMRGEIIGPLKYKGHVAEYSELFDDDTGRAQFKSSSLCGSCHDIVVPAHFSGAPTDQALERTYSEWQGSVFADPTSMNRLNCTSGGGCHMQREPNVPIANPPAPHPTMPSRVARHYHDFPAIDTALVDGFPEAEAQMAAVKKKLESQFRIQICVDPSLGSGMTVIVENLAAGHNFPSGASQDRRVWTEVHAYQKGMEVFSSGVVPPGTPATEVDGTWILYDQAFKADGQTPAHMFWDVASLKPQTIPVSTPANMNSNLVGHPFRIPKLPSGGIAQPDRATVTIWIEPIGLEVIDDMIKSTFLDMSFRGKVPRIAVKLADGSPDGGASPVTFEWTVAKAMGPDGSQMNGQLCYENTKTKFPVTPPPQK